MLSAQEALERLREGNHRFVSGNSRPAVSAAELRSGAHQNQAPFAIVLGCSDSRVPAEIVFDQGLGDLFVIRVAGNIAAPSQVGSVEFAAANFGTRLVVVLGHTECGAIQATLGELADPSHDLSPNLRAIVDLVRPSIHDLASTDPGGDPETLVARAVRANVNATVDQLRNGSAVLGQLIRDDGLRVVGAEFSLETGEVEFDGF